MTRNARTILFISISAAVGALAAAGPAFARANCYKWEGSDSFRCFDCMKQEWIEGGWHRVNTCAPREFPKREGGRRPF